MVVGRARDASWQRAEEGLRRHLRQEAVSRGHAVRMAGGGAKEVMLGREEGGENGLETRRVGEIRKKEK